MVLQGNYIEILHLLDNYSIFIKKGIKNHNLITIITVIFILIKFINDNNKLIFFYYYFNIIIILLFNII